MTVMMMMVMMVMMMVITTVSANSPPRFLLDTNVGSEIVLRLTEGEDSQASILRWVELLLSVAAFFLPWGLGDYVNKHFEPVLVCCGFFLTVR